MYRSMAGKPFFKYPRIAILLGRVSLPGSLLGDHLKYEVYAYLENEKQKRLEAKAKGR